ncbi:MAG: hypothetical protein NVV82_26615 [Sporocytophaga sp.]|nr:hypothetical protein [Sporocytophaga sp.]
MFEPQNRIIIVDNLTTELETLGKSFFQNGLGCRTFVYSAEYYEPLKNVRIAFFDINLTSNTVDHNYESIDKIITNNSAVFNDLAIAINQYIHKDNGPYALFFWTANKGVVEAFIKYMQTEERGYSDTASPILVSCIDKTEYSSNKNDIDDEQQIKLSQRILSLFNNEKIKFLFGFEENSRIAGEKTLNRIYDILPKDKKWGESSILFDNIDKVFSKIAASTLGFEFSKENPQRAIYEGLLPISNNEFLNLNSKVNWSEIVTSLLKASKYSDLKSPEIDILNKVNSVFHIEKSNGSKDRRGVVIEIDKTKIELINSFGLDDINKWFQKILAIKDGKDYFKSKLFEDSKLIAVEFSAACDYSNKKSRINKYILGVLTPYIDTEKDINLKSRVESSYHVGGCSFHIEGFNNKQVWLNLNYVFGAKSDDARFGESLFVLKKEIMDMIGNKYASHISRIGITSIH